MAGRQVTQETTDCVPFEIAARAVCAAEAGDMSEAKRAAYVEAHWRARHPLLIAAHARFMERQNVR